MDGWKPTATGTNLHWPKPVFTNESICGVRLILPGQGEPENQGKCSRCLKILAADQSHIKL